MFHPKFHEQFTLPTFHKCNASHLSNLVAIDEYGVADCQSSHVIVHGVVSVAPRKGVEAFQVVDPQHQQHDARDDEHPNFEF